MKTLFVSGTLLCASLWAAPNPAQLAQVKQLLQQKCAVCHSPGKNADAEASIRNALDPQLMQRRRRAIRVAVSSDAMPPDRPLIASEKEILFKWIDDGAPSFNAETPVQPSLSDDAAVDLIAKDLQSLGAQDQVDARYLTLHAISNAGVNTAGLETHRQAITKLVNSLSWAPELVKPIGIDPGKLILRISLRSLHWNARIWEALAERYPYDAVSTAEPWTTALRLTGSRIPLVRGDWFVVTASAPPFYHDFLELPANLRTLEERLGVNLRENYALVTAERAGLLQSGVSNQNRIIERHPIRNGSYWKSFDFASSVGNKSILQNPLGPVAFFGKDESFDHDGGEVIFSLPNGLQGYLLVDKADNRIDLAPINVVSDRTRRNPTIINGVSCMSCHFRGMRDGSDEVHTAYEARQHKDREKILKLYPGNDAIRKSLAVDQQRFEKALKAIDVVPGNTPQEEAIFKVGGRYEDDLQRSHVAAELGVSEVILERKLTESTTLEKNLSAVVRSGGRIRRDTFEQEFPELVRELRGDLLKTVAQENRELAAAQERERQRIAAERLADEAARRIRAEQDAERARQRRIAVYNPCVSSCSSTKRSCVGECESRRGQYYPDTAVRVCTATCDWEFLDCDNSCKRRAGL